METLNDSNGSSLIMDILTGVDNVLIALYGRIRGRGGGAKGFVECIKLPPLLGYDNFFKTTFN